MRQVFIGFVPWIVYWSILKTGLWHIAISGGLITALAIVLFRYIRRQTFKTLEVGTLGYFSIHAVVTLIAGSMILVKYGSILNNLVLAAIAFGTLALNSPFTYQYAKEDWDEAYWQNEVFISINKTITKVWGGIFIFNSLLGSVAIFFLPELDLLFTVILPNLTLLGGIVFSSLFPARRVQNHAKARLDVWDPYKWTAPKFNTRPTTTHEHDIIVIGSGIGGLSAAAILAKRGLKVALFEQHFLPGGFCTSWKRSVRPSKATAGMNDHWVYTFDAGVHDVSGLGKRGSTRSLLRMLDIEDAIEWKLNQHEYFLGDFHFKVPQDSEKFVQLLGEQFPTEKENIQRFFQEISHVYREMYSDTDKTGGAPRIPDNIGDLLAYPRTHPHAYRWMDRPFGEMLKTFIADPDAKNVLSVLTGYLSDDPTSLTVGDMAPIFGYYFDGGYYPMGGSQILPDTLVREIEKHGGQLYLRTAVERIMIKYNCAIGVQLKNGQTHYARAIISNADVQNTFQKLVGYEHLPMEYVKNIQSIKSSTSAFAVFLGLSFVPDIASITILDDMGVMAPSKIDPSLAPLGHTSVTLLKLLPQPALGNWDRKADEYNRRKHEFADRMVSQVERIIPEIRSHITYQQEGSPASFARYAWTTDGGIYGSAAGQKRLAIKTPVEYLYLAGSGVMGGGVEAAIISGIHAANEILRDQ